MPIAAFNNVTDGLDPSRRNHGHFIVNTNLNDDGPWVPYAWRGLDPALLF